MAHAEHEKAVKTVHTPEPWSIEQCSGSSKDRNILDAEGMRIVHANSPENARRIVACVNACAGMTNEQIDNICMISGSLLNRFGEQMAYLGQVEKQRDELLSVLEPLRLKFRSGNCIPVERNVITAKEWATVEEAIASVRGSAA